MTDTEAASKRGFPARVAQVVDETTVVLNRGASDGVKSGQRFLLYALSQQEIVDPETGGSLGRLELVRGTGKVVHLQERLCTLASDILRPAERTVVHRKSPLFYLGDIQEETITPSREPAPLKDVTVGDLARPI